MGVTPFLFALEPNKKYKNFLRKHFTLYEDVAQIPEESTDFIALFHVLEHLRDPAAVLDSLYSKLTRGGKVLIEIPSSDNVLLKLYSSEAFAKFTYWSSHLYLFNSKTLRKLIGKTAYNIKYIKPYQRYTLANHLYWLAKGKPGGHIAWNFLDDQMLQEQYEKKLAEMGQSDTIVAMLSRG